MFRRPTCECFRKRGDLTLPTFIIIGAAKAGTTALYWYFAEHPDVYMSPVKETFYFAYGVDEKGNLLYGDPDVHRFPIKTRAEYEALFAAAGDAKAIGEASPIYLECPQAAGRIRATIPEARLICSLRHPIERAYSDYQMYLRRRGRRFDPSRDLRPDAPWARPDSRWMQVGRYHEQLRRYYERFPREQLYVFLMGDMKRDALGLVQRLYRFVGVNPGFVPDFDTPHNVGGMPASPLLERVFTNRSLKKAIEPLMPKRAANLIRRLRTSSMREAPPLSPELKSQLTAPFRDEIRQTGDLIQRDLEHWL
jgi:hypothetical protein